MENEQNIEYYTSKFEFLFDINLGFLADLGILNSMSN